MDKNVLDSLTGWRTWMLAGGRPRTTVKLRVYQLTRFCESHPEPLAASLEDLAEWLVGQEWSPATMQSYRAALKSFYKWAVLAGRVPSSPAEGLPVVEVPARAPDPAPVEMIEDALSRSAERERLMVDLGFRCGMRAGEIAVCHSDDLRRRIAGWDLVVHGKGRKDRTIPIPTDVAVRVKQAGGWVFPGRINGHLSSHRVSELLSAALRRRPHTLRHRYATNTYEETGDIYVVKELLGHAKVETTQIYAGVSSERLRAAVRWAA